MAGRPRFQRKHDRIANPGQTTREQIAVDHALAPFDRAAREMDTRWGIDRLPEMVSPETAARYGRTLGSLNAAIDAEDVETAHDRAAACIRGMKAMDAEAVALGHCPDAAPVVVLDGFDFGILLDDRQWRKAEKQHPGLRLYSLRELAVLAQAAEGNHPLMAPVKDAFPGATVKAVRSKLEKELGDEIPF